MCLSLSLCVVPAIQQWLWRLSSYNSIPCACSPPRPPISRVLMAVRTRGVRQRKWAPHSGGTVICKLPHQSHMPQQKQHHNHHQRQPHARLTLNAIVGQVAASQPVSWRNQQTHVVQSRLSFSSVKFYSNRTIRMNSFRRQSLDTRRTCVASPA